MAIFGQTCNIRAKSLDFGALSGENIWARDSAPPPNETGPVCIYASINTDLLLDGKSCLICMMLLSLNHAVYWGQEGGGDGNRVLAMFFFCNLL